MPRVYSYVRMSTPKQEWGLGLQRQDEATQAYAKARGWELLEQNQLRDKGLSAYTGKHLGGALGRFLAAIREGKVEAGSVLLVESLDRLSRQEGMKALRVFTEITTSGVTIHTLADGKTYDEQSDFQDLMISLVTMARAHDESKMKSHRSKANWANKRKNAASRPLTSQCPAWLRLNKDENKFEVIRERANVVRSIYRDSAAGLGIYAIMTKLNKNRVPVFGRSKGGWHKSAVDRILTNRAVMGELQPHHLVNGKSEPEGPVLKNYYPAIINDELFYRVQAAREQRREKGGGRKGKHLSNLFTGLAYCAYCQNPMRYINKGNRPRGGQYLVCDRANRGMGCEKTVWRYQDFETSFLAFVSEIDLDSVLRADVGADLDEIDALRGRLASIKSQQERLLQLYLDTPHQTPDFVRQKLAEFEQQRIKTEAGIKTKEQARANAKAEAQQAHEIKADIARLQQTNGDDDLYALRAKVAARLKTIIKEIKVASAGSLPICQFYLHLLKHKPESKATVRLSFVLPGDAFPAFRRFLEAGPKTNRAGSIQTFEQMIREGPKRFFTVTFKDDTRRMVYPSDDPLQYVAQTVSGEQMPLEDWMKRSGIKELRPGVQFTPETEEQAKRWLTTAKKQKPKSNRP